MIRERSRRGTLTSRDAARAGKAIVRRWMGEGQGQGWGRGEGQGQGWGRGEGWGQGWGEGWGQGWGEGWGQGQGRGEGWGQGRGEGWGEGWGQGEGEGFMDSMDLLDVGSPVVVRCYTSGVFVGRIRAGSDGSVALTDWRWLRSWSGTGGEGSVYDLVASDVRPHDRGPLTSRVTILQQADVMAIDEAAYTRLSGG